MSTRQERQREKTLFRKALKKQNIADPVLRKLLRDEIERGSGTEVYRLDDDGADHPMYFNVSAMRDWASKHCEIFSFPPDMDRARRLIESGAVDPSHIQNHTIQTEMTPIIICRGLRNADQIVDGAHRFVAACMGAAMVGMNVPFIPGYVLHPDEWKPFIIPQATAEAFAAQR